MTRQKTYESPLIRAPPSTTMASNVPVLSATGYNQRWFGSRVARGLRAALTV